MFLILQISLTVLACLCVAAVVPVGALINWGWGAFCALLAFLFFVFMKICKTQVEIDEAKKQILSQTQEHAENEESKTEKDEKENK